MVLKVASDARGSCTKEIFEIGAKISELEQFLCSKIALLMQNYAKMHKFAQELW